MVSNDMSGFCSGGKADQGELDTTVLAYVEVVVDTAGGKDRVVADSPASLKSDVERKQYADTAGLL